MNSPRNVVRTAFLFLVAALLVAATATPAMGQVDRSSNGLPETEVKAHYASEEDLIEVMFSADSKPRLRNGALLDRATNAMQGVTEVLDKLAWHEWQRICDVPEEKLDEIQLRGQTNTGKPVYNLNNIYRLRVPKGLDVWEISRQLEALPGVMLARPVPKPAPPPSAQIGPGENGVSSAGGGEDGMQPEIQEVRAVLNPELLPSITKPAPPQDYEILGAVTIVNEDFEGTFPSGSWSLVDESSTDGGEYLWGKDDYDKYSGTYSMWCAAAGADALDPQFDNYVNNMNTWAIYGPFDLSGPNVYDAELTFMRRTMNADTGDRISWLASHDGVNFSGYQGFGFVSWVQTTLDLTNVSGDNMLGDDSVWIAFRFTSSASGTNKGTWVDDVVLRKFTGPDDYEYLQGYLDPASDTPTGVDAEYAWSRVGGDGTGVTVCDLEYNWNYDHADITKAVGSQINPDWTDNGWSSDHGTAVIGELVSDKNGWGTTGICYGASLKTCGTIFASPSPNWNVPGAMALAIAELSPGDVIILEQQWDYTGSNDYVPVEWWLNYSPNPQSFNGVYAAIVNAVSNGIHVVEAGGNGYYDTDALTWYGDSGAIIVGAGGAYTGGDWEPGDLQKLPFSDYGSRFNLQGWGEDVYSTGYGDRFNGRGEDYYYTDSFSGTSSASPIVAGSVACCVGYWVAQGGSAASLTPANLRDILEETGTPQVTPPDGYIGPRPDLLAAFASLSTFPEVTVTDPNGGELLAAGSEFDITWNATDTGGIDSVSIYYSVDGGDTYDLISSGEANDGVYRWTVPYTPTDSAMVKVIAYDPGLNAGEDTSDDVFTIADETDPTVTVLIPNGGEIWYIGGGYDITWTAYDAVGVDSVSIYYSIDGGDTYDLIASGEANDGIYPWTVPYTPTDSAMVKVIAYDPSLNTGEDTSDSRFSLADTTDPAVTVLSPNGGEIWYIGGGYDITWTAYDAVGVDSVSIYYSVDDGDTYDLVASGEANDGVYPWTVPTAPTDSALVKIIAYDPSLNTGEDTSDSRFTITEPPDTTDPAVTVLTPNGGETWYGRDNKDITWTATDANGVDSVSIFYSLDGGGDYHLICSGEANDGTYTWLVPDTFSVTALVKVVAYDPDLNAGEDESDAVFTIADNTGPIVDVLTPDGGESIMVWDDYDITWTAVDPSGVDSVSILYSIDGGDTYELIASEEANDGTYSWSVPNVLTDSALVKIIAYDTNVTAGEGGSDSLFVIWAGTTDAPGGRSHLGDTVLLWQNSPNPFAPGTNISFYLPEEQVVYLEVFDAKGRLVDVLINGDGKSAGVHTVPWSGKDRNGARVSSGVYFYRFRAGSVTLVKKMVMTQ
jgi:hypothetical protein